MLGEKPTGAVLSKACCRSPAADPATVDSLLNEGRQAESAKDYDRAEIYYRKAFDADPGSITAQRALGDLAMTRGQPGNAMLFYQAAVNEDPDDAELWLALAEARAEAVAEAEAAATRGEVPVGAIVIREGEIIARAGNRRRTSCDPTAHAELIVLREAGEMVGDWRLSECTLYVTLEPCPMCAAACREARLQLVIWGAEDERVGALGTVIDLATDPRLGPPLAHRGGLEADRSRELLRSFFAKQRHSS